MESPHPQTGGDEPCVAGFETTHWSAVWIADRYDEPFALSARENLCRKYWPPLFGFARRQGYPDPEAEDLTQGFFAHILKHQLFRTANPTRGRFRTFLLSCFQNFIREQWSREHAAKRGGVRNPVSLDVVNLELEGVPQTSPEDREFDRAWAERIFALALARLGGEFEAADKSAEFSRLKPFLSLSGDREQYAQVAADLDLNARSVPVAVFRMRQRFAALVRREVLQTVSDASQLEDELQHLIRIMSH
ncbi:MAG: sigma-70 family RNA polymerase sigma factor [Verrucomicrobiales bacterium]|nr:sigma-70 family RNA polymerase sigma factor [Verrucomicrobiales bacterium]